MLRLRGRGTLPKLKLTRSQAYSTFRSRLYNIMAQNPALTAFLGRLDSDVGAGTCTEFLTSTGRRLVASHVLPEKDFVRCRSPPAFVFSARTESALHNLCIHLHYV